MKPFRLLLLLLFLPACSYAQSTTLIGEWEGYIQTPTTKLGLKFTFKADGKKDFKGTMDVPSQQLVDLPLTEIDFNSKDGKLRFSVPDVPGNSKFRGKVALDSMKGSWIQGGLPMPTYLSRFSDEEALAQAASLDHKVAEFKSYVDSVMKTLHVPGVSVALVVGGEAILTEGFGAKDLEQNTSVDAQTLFCIGSCSKAFTATGLGILADEGKLDWEKPIREYLPGFRMQDPFAHEHLNAIDLLCHRSGLPRHDLAWIGAPDNRQELFSRIYHLEPNESFRSTWQYQNFMVMTAGILGGELNGNSWEELTRNKIFSPLGMDQSNLSLAEWNEAKNKASSYQWIDDQGQFKKLPYRNIDAIGPAGSINSNAEDMSKWLLFQVGNGRFQGKKILSLKEIRRQRTPVIAMGTPGQEPVLSQPMYGLGWMTYFYQGLSAINHGGNIDGFSAEVFVIPGQQFGIAVLTNLDRTRFPTAVCLEAADIFLDLNRNDWASQFKGTGLPNGMELGEEKPIAGTLPSHPLKHYVGTFSHPGYGTLEIEMKADTLYSLYNGFRFPLTHWHYDIFDVYNEYVGLHQKYNFRTGSDGYIESVEVPLEITIDDIEFAMLPPPRLSDPEFMTRLTGKYDVEVFTAVIELEAGHLLVKAPGQPDYILEPMRGTQYKFQDLNGFSIEFLLDENDNPEEILVRQPGAMIRGEKIE